MQVFCDESGGSDPANTAFLVAAVAIQPVDAARLVKSFRKATGCTGEIKGHDFTLAQRAIFLDLLARQPDTVSVVVICQRRDAVGGWAMRALSEPELYGHLLTEACLALPGLDQLVRLAVTPDQPRYTKDRAGLVRGGLIQALTARHPVLEVTAEFRDSAATAGLQVADAVVNTLFQLASPTPARDAVAPMLARLLAQSTLTVRNVQLVDRRPAWLSDK